MRIIAICDVRTDIWVQAAGRFPRLQTDPGYHSKICRVEPRRHRAGLQRYAPMQAKLHEVTGAPISKPNDTRGPCAT